MAAVAGADENRAAIAPATAPATVTAAARCGRIDNDQACHRQVIRNRKLGNANSS
jgi:hypothetical protein